MFEIEDISLGHQELFTSKYSSAVNDYCSADMDLYLDTPDAFSLLDIEIKNEMEIVLTSQSEISYNFADVPDIDDCSGDPGNWFSTSSNHSNSNLFDFCNEGASRMVNPNSVMPLSTSKSMTPTLASSQNLDSESPSPKPSHLTFSPASVRISSVKLDNEEINTVKKDLSSSLNTIKSNENNLPSYSVQVLRPKPIHVLTTKSMTKSTQGILNNHAVKISQKHLASTVSMAQLDVLTNNSRGVSNNAARKNKKYRDDEDNPYPKPTYSYSCLIAMALKNSRTGSLPVSEIYNFMCEHFPYFKTAPTGWKNSVRHNLSLNKCFEKIEKPAVSGSQRKGCLWAMHPDKISKMDEEVQKWSRKDPAAIRRAMIYPEQLESLEKGELKYGSDNYLDADSTSESDIEGELEEIEVENHIILKEESRNDYVEINSIGDSYDEASLTDYDNDNPDNMYEELEVENEKDALRMEIALAQEELFKFDKNGLSNGSPSKRARSSTANVSEYVYQPISSGRRKAPLLVRNNSNTSFIEVTGE